MNDSSIDKETQALRDAFGQRSVPSDTLACLPSELIFEAANGELGAPELNPVLDHVASCALCTQAWLLATDMAPPTTSTRVNRRPLFGGLAAAAVLALSASLLVSTNQPDTFEPQYRGADQHAAISSSAPESLTRTDFTLSWESTQIWPSYTVNLMTSDLEQIWSASDLSAPQIKVPAEVLPEIGRDQSLLWQVEAWQDGVRRQLSPMFRVNLIENERGTEPQPK